MKDVKNLNSCASADNKCGSVLHRVNMAFNMVGVMFFITFFGYIAIHCF